MSHMCSGQNKSKQCGTSMSIWTTITKELFHHLAEDEATVLDNSDFYSGLVWRDK